MGENPGVRSSAIPLTVPDTFPSIVEPLSVAFFLPASRTVTETFERPFLPGFPAFTEIEPTTTSAACGSIR